MSEPTIDRATFEALQEAAGADFVRELVETFLVEAPIMLDDLRSARAANDAERFRRAAHSLKSNSMTFGALSLGAMARALELGGLGPVQQPGNTAVAELAHEYERVARALTEQNGA